MNQLTALVFNSWARSQILAVASAARHGLFLMVTVSLRALFEALLLPSARPERLAWLCQIGWTSSPFAGRQRLGRAGQRGSVAAGGLWNVWGEGVGVGARRAADSCHGLRLSPGTTSLPRCLLTPSQSKSHSKPPPTLSPTLIFPFCPHSRH